MKPFLAIFLITLSTSVFAQYPSVSIRQIQEVPADSLLLLDSLGCIRWTAQASPYYGDTVIVTGVCVVPAKVLNYTASGFNLLLADTGSQAEWGGVFVRPNVATGSPDTILAIQWGVLQVAPGDIIRFVGYVDEFPETSCASTTQVVPLLNHPLEIIGTAPVPPPVAVRVPDFYQGAFPLGGRIHYSTGEKYEGMRVRIKNVVVASYLNVTNCTFTFVDSSGNTMSDFDASKWFTCRGHRDPSSTFALPAIGTRIDSIVGYILSNSGAEAARGYRIAPIFYPELAYTGVLLPPTVVQSFALHQNYPNPFNPATVIPYELPVGTLVSLKVYTVLGVEVTTLVEGHIQAGVHEVRFDGSALAGGVYFYQLKASSFVQTKKLVLLK